ncbi:MAG: polyphosphate kinase 1 [Nodosilinea sp.]
MAEFSPYAYLNRELSWLEFNRRILHQALDSGTPLLEAIRFLSSFSDNLDEFFMVRVAALKHQQADLVTQTGPDGLSPQQQLHAISKTLRPMVRQQHDYFGWQLRPQLAGQGIVLLDYGDLEVDQRDYLSHYVEHQILPVLTSLKVDPGQPLPYLSNLSLNLAVLLTDCQAAATTIAWVKIPRVLPRLVTLPTTLGSQPHCRWLGLPLEQAIAPHLATLFPGLEVVASYLFRVTRDADLALEEDEADDLMLVIEQELRRRHLRESAVRLEVQSGMPTSLQHLLMQALGLDSTDVYEIKGMVGLGDLITLTALPAPDLKESSWTPVIPTGLSTTVPSVDGIDSQAADLFALLRHQDHLFHHPYHSFVATVQRFITQAAADPQVLAIKMTLYRTSGDSPIVKALIAAAGNGKQVTVVVELKARFDEENNIHWARQLEQAGVHVVYGVLGFKTHVKMVLVVRREGDRINRYVHFGTGNYNPKTARSYTDLGLLSAHPDLGADAAELFNYLTGYSRQCSYRQILVAPVSLRQQLVNLIQGEIDQADRGRQARIIAKLNALVDPELTALLYKASQAGVSIDLIVRGICCLRPGLAGISNNIRVISIVGPFLEHSRLVYFHHGGDEILLIGSADWMTSNLDQRVEVLVPIRDRVLQSELKLILDLALVDNCQAWDMATDGSYIQRRPGVESPRHFQQLMMARYRRGGRGDVNRVTIDPT